MVAGPHALEVVMDCIRTFLLGLVCVLAACGSEQDQQTGRRLGLPKQIVRLGWGHSLGESVTASNLTVWPVFSDKEPEDLGNFVTLAEAQKRGVATVREHANETVNTLVIENKGEDPILVCSGTVVKGGNQDRQIGQDFVIRAGATVPVDAFCVEAGRWSSSRGGSDTSGLFQAISKIAPSRIRNKTYLRDQSAVWTEVSTLRHQGAITIEFSSQTSLVDVLEANLEGTSIDPKKLSEPVNKHFAALRKEKNEPVGFAYAINGEPVGVRIFAHPRILHGQLAGFVDSMCLEALLTKSEKEAKCTSEEVVAFVKSINTARERVIATNAANTNAVRLGRVGFSNSCFVHVKGKNTAVALTRDWTRR